MACSGIIAITHDVITENFLRDAVSFSNLGNRLSIFSTTSEAVQFLKARLRSDCVVIMDAKLPSLEYLLLSSVVPDLGHSLLWSIRSDPHSKTEESVRTLADSIVPLIDVNLGTQEASRVIQLKAATVAGKKMRIGFERTLKRSLSKRQVEVISLIAQGFTRKEISSKLKLSRSTVNTHCEQIFEKLEVHKISDVTRLAIAHDIT